VVNSSLVNSDEQNRPHPGKLRRTATSTPVWMPGKPSAPQEWTDKYAAERAARQGYRHR
jgi:hypothetical protein